MKINLTDKYKTRSGLDVTVYRTDLRGIFPVLVVVHDTVEDKVYRYTSDGRHFDYNYKSFDLIKVLPYEHIKIDDKVLVWDNDYKDNQARAYFAGVNHDGKPLSFAAGHSYRG